MRRDLKGRLEKLEAKHAGPPTDGLDTITDAEWVALAEFRHGERCDEPKGSPARIAAAQRAAAAAEKG
ncbi:MAG TPA: hypothetical protein VD838_00955 [Anaeromyxobacteraceae bacterium]|nr:hypothetical protein [Anaeromyxobacteraceae bacterium]